MFFFFNLKLGSRLTELIRLLGASALRDSIFVEMKNDLILANMPVNLLVLSKFVNEKVFSSARFIMIGGIHVCPSFYLV